MSITTILGMIPKGGRYAKSVVNFVHKTVDDWPKFQSAIKQITDLLKQGKLRLDGKQKTIFETNKNILKNHEKVIKDTTDKWIAETFPSSKKEFPAFNTSKEDPFKGWKPTLVERSQARNIYKDIAPPKVKYTDEMSVIDEELDALAFGGDKYAHLSVTEKNKIMKTLQAEMKQLIAKGEDKFPRLDPDNDAFIITGLDEAGDPIKMSRFTAQFGATKNPITGELTRKEGTSFWDKWDAKKNKIRKEGEEVWHETLDREGKVIMSNPDYKVTTKKKDRPNIRLIKNYEKELTDIELAQEGYNLQEITVIKRAREVMKKENQNPNDALAWVRGEMADEAGIEFEEFMTDFDWGDFPGDTDFAHGGSVPGFATGGISNLFQERQGYRSGELITKGIKLVKGARWLIKQLKSVLDDMIYGSGDVKSIFSKMPEAEKVKIFNQTEAAIKQLESGGPIPDEILTNLRNDARFKGLTVSKTADKDFREMNEVVLGKLPKGKGEIIEGKAVEKVDLSKYTDKDLNALVAEDKKILAEANKLSQAGTNYGRVTEIEARRKEINEILEAAQKVPESGYSNFKADLALEKQATKGTGEKILEGTVVDEKVELFAFMDQLPKELQHKVALLPIDQQLPLLRKFKEAFEATKTGGAEGGMDVLRKQFLEDFIPKGKPHATGGLIDGYATGGVSNLFRQRQGFRTGNIAKLPEFIKFVEGLLMKASNEIRRGLGKWKGLADKQKWAQHDNLTKIVTEFMRTKKFDPKMNEYFGIDAEKAFIEAQAKATRLEKKGPNWKEQEVKAQQYADKMEAEMWDEGRDAVDSLTGEKELIKRVKIGQKGAVEEKITRERTMDDLVEDAYKEVFYQKPSSGDYKYDADVLAEEIASQGGKIYDDLAAVEKAGIYDLAYKRVIKDLKARMDFKKDLKDVEQKIELQMFDPKGKKGNAEGGLIQGYATGGVSNLFRSR